MRVILTSDLAQKYGMGLISDLTQHYGMDLTSDLETISGSICSKLERRHAPSPQYNGVKSIRIALCGGGSVLNWSLYLCRAQGSEVAV